MRINNDYFWNIVFALFFVGCVLFGIIILRDHAYRPLGVTSFELVILSLATFRLIRLVVYDKITAFFRDQFFNETGTGELVKPERGPRRTLAELLLCPWCFGLWAGATVAFFYYLTPYAWFPILFLAISAVGTFLQLLSNLVGWKAEETKDRIESR